MIVKLASAQLEGLHVIVDVAHVGENIWNGLDICRITITLKEAQELKTETIDWKGQKVMDASIFEWL